MHQEGWPASTIPAFHKFAVAHGMAMLEQGCIATALDLPLKESHQRASLHPEAQSLTAPPAALCDAFPRPSHSGNLILPLDINEKQGKTERQKETRGQFKNGKEKILLAFLPKPEINSYKAIRARIHRSTLQQAWL